MNTSSRITGSARGSLWRLLIWTVVPFGRVSDALSTRPTSLSPSSHRLTFRTKTTSLYANWYGRGSDIWPPTNIEFPVRLEDSFPGGQVPQIALSAMDGEPFMDKLDLLATQRRVLRWISFLALTASMVGKGVIGPMDIGGLLVWAFYNYLLVQLADTGDGIASVPSAGHVPHLVRNPLQNVPFKEGQVNWDTWFNFVFPIALIVIGGATEATLTEEWWRVALGRPLLWWMATQVADDFLESSNTFETISPVPLPIQYLIRLSSRCARWALLTVAIVVTQWPSLVVNSGANPVSVWSYVYGFLPLLHWIVSTCQVFGYWIPIAGMQYMRAHWTSTEAETMTIQPTAAHHYTQASPPLRIND